MVKSPPDLPLPSLDPSCLPKGAGKGSGAKGEPKGGDQGAAGSDPHQDATAKEEELARSNEAYEMGSRFRILAESQDEERGSTGFCTPKADDEGGGESKEDNWDPAKAAAGLEDTLPSL